MRKCKCCGKMFEKQYGNKYCSTVCANEMMSRRAHKWQEDHYIREYDRCIVCGESIKGTYCKKVCWNCSEEYNKQQLRRYWQEEHLHKLARKAVIDSLTDEEFFEFAMGRKSL